MKLAFCTEDRADEAILLALLKRLAPAPVEAHAERYGFERGGWTNALRLAPIMARAAHKAGIDGVVFAIDNDAGEPVHVDEHDAKPEDQCRHCALRRAANVEELVRWPRPELPPLRFVFVVPVRTIETWLALASGAAIPGNTMDFGRTAAERKRLKQLVYKTDRPDTALMIERGVEIVERADLRALEQHSPSFRQFAAQAVLLRQ